MHTERTPSFAPETPRPHLEELLDEALADSFPASDPVSSLMADDLPASATPAMVRLRDSYPEAE
jgi:hypothetical protein